MERFYRDILSGSLETYEITYKESNLLIKSCENADKFAVFEYLKQIRDTLDLYIQRHRKFFSSLKPITQDSKAPKVARTMIEHSSRAGVGPMACVAGVFADEIGKFILKRCEECIVENGGDIFIKVNYSPTIGIYTDNPIFRDRIKFRLPKSQTPYGVCSSSSSIGPSLSMGSVDISVIIADSAGLADGIATACGNIVKSEEDLPRAVELSKQLGATGCILIKGKKMALWGNLELIQG